MQRPIGEILEPEQGQPLIPKEERAQSFLAWARAVRLPGVSISASLSQAEDRKKEAVEVEMFGNNEQVLEIIVKKLMDRAALQHAEVTVDTGVHKNSAKSSDKIRKLASLLAGFPVFTCSLEFEFKKPRKELELPIAD